MVSPCIVKSFSQLGNVHDVFNAILVRGDAIGDVVFYGKGAGKLPTASAVVADVIDCAKHANRKKIFGWGDSEPGYIADYTQLETELYIRATADDKEKAFEDIEKVFGDITVLYRRNAPANEFAFITELGKECVLTEKLNSIKSITPCSVIRVTDY
jgi:homoserine dehydrogenase